MLVRGGDLSILTWYRNPENLVGSHSNGREDLATPNEGACIKLSAQHSPNKIT